MNNPLVKVILIVLGLGTLYYIFPYLLPFIIALVIAVLMEPLVLFLQKNVKLSRNTAVAINFLVFLLVLCGLMFIGSARLFNQMFSIFRQMPAYSSKVAEGIKNLVERAQVVFEDMPPELIQESEIAVRETVNIGNRISSGAVVLLDTAKLIPDVLIIFIISLVALYLFSLHLNELKNGFLQLFSEQAKGKVMIILNDINKAIIGFCRAQLIISFFTYILIWMGLKILGINYAMAVSLLIVIVDVLPILGTGFVMLPWAAFLFIINEGAMAAGILILYVLIIIVRRIIEPKVLGRNIGLSPLATVISMYVGYKVFGISGFFIGPAICIIFIAMRKAGFFQQKIDF